MRAKLIKENISDFLQSKSKDQIDNDFELYIEDVADMLVNNDYFNDFLDAFTFLTEHKNIIKQLILDNYDKNDIFNYFANENFFI